jgi:hypothetical protein
VTYVCERPGRAQLPVITLSWWNVERQELESVQLPAVDLEIGHAPLSRTTRLWFAGLAGGALVLGLLALWRFRDRLRAAWRRRRAAWADGEAGRFARVQRACRDGDAVAAYNALLAWLEVRHAGDDPATIAGDLLATDCKPELRGRMRELEDAVTNDTRDWDGPALAATLQAWRRGRGRHAAASDEGLPALNPRKASHNPRGS